MFHGVLQLPQIGAPQADPILCGQLSKVVAFLQLLDHHPETVSLCQAGTWVAMHGCMKFGLLGRTSTCSGLTPACQLSNALKQNS